MTKMGAYSIEEFCKNHKISRAHFYNLQKKQLTPRMMKVGRRMLISEEAAIDWRKKMEQIS